MLKIQSRINILHHRWFSYVERDWGDFTLSDKPLSVLLKPITGPLGITGQFITRDWNLALEDSGKYKEGATLLYKFMDFLKLRYEEEKQKVIKQKDKVQNIKNNLS